ncbi:MAG: hypothetical protein WBA71_06025 [Candidatus Humimicrobiia bacterium]
MENKKNEKDESREERLLLLIKRTLPGKIIEFGCGDGNILQILSETYPKSLMVGVDIEFLSKHFSPTEKDWKDEMKEAHFSLTMDDYSNELEKEGFEIVWTKELPWYEQKLREIRKDFIFHNESELKSILIIAEKICLFEKNLQKNDLSIKNTSYRKCYENFKNTGGYNGMVYRHQRAKF